MESEEAHFPARMDMMNIEREIRDALSGRAPGVDPERLDWDGYTWLIDRYGEASPAERKEIRRALVAIIEEAVHSDPSDVDWRLISDSTHLAYTLRVRAAVSPVKELDPSKAGEYKRVVERQRENLLMYFSSSGPTHSRAVPY